MYNETDGSQVPYMISGTIIAIIGAGLLITINTNTSTVQWATYMVINGLGTGIAQQLPYTALQVVLRYLNLVDITKQQSLIFH